MRWWAALGAVVASLAAAPGAQAAAFTVSTDANTGAGSLRDAILSANASAGPDTISFSGARNISLTTTITATEAVTIADTGGDVIVRHSGSGPAIAVASGASGVVISGLSFAGAAQPIDLAGTANGGVQPPAGLSVSGRGPTGTVVTGTTTGPGTVELLRGDPGSTAGAAFFDRFDVPGGAFSRLAPAELPTGTTFAATFTAATGTSELVSATVPADVTPPFVVGAVATSQTTVRVQLSEPINPASVQAEDFSLVMAGRERPISAISLSADGAQVMLGSSLPWRAGEAGVLSLRAAGAIVDVAGNPSVATDAARVAAAPGDVVLPFASSLSIRPGSICLTKTRRCRRPGGRIRFIASEDGRATLVVLRVNTRIGVSKRYDVRTGPNQLRFNGRLRGTKLRRGRYRLLVYLEDAVGNVTDEPPVQRFSVRRAI